MIHYCYSQEIFLNLPTYSPHPVLTAPHASLCFCSVHSPTDGHLGCVHTLAAVNNAAVNTGLRISFGIGVFIFLDKRPELGLLGNNTVLPFILCEEPANCYTQGLRQFTIPPTVHEGSLFSRSLLSTQASQRKGRGHVISALMLGGGREGLTEAGDPELTEHSLDSRAAVTG